MHFHLGPGKLIHSHAIPCSCPAKGCRIHRIKEPLAPQQHANGTSQAVLTEGSGGSCASCYRSCETVLQQRQDSARQPWPACGTVARSLGTCPLGQQSPGPPWRGSAWTTSLRMCSGREQSFIHQPTPTQLWERLPKLRGSHGTSFVNKNPRKSP